MILSTDELSNALGITTRRIQALESEGVLKKLDRNQWDLTNCINDYLDYKIKEATSRLELSEARAKKELAQAELAQMQLDKERGNLIEIDKLEIAITNIILKFSKDLSALAKNIRKKTGIDINTQAEISQLTRQMLELLQDSQAYKPI